MCIRDRYGTAGYETAKELFKNRVIDQHTFSVSYPAVPYSAVNPLLSDTI